MCSSQMNRKIAQEKKKKSHLPHNNCACDILIYTFLHRCHNGYYACLIIHVGVGVLGVWCQKCDSGYLCYCCFQINGINVRSYRHEEVVSCQLRSPSFLHRHNSFNSLSCLRWWFVSLRHVKPIFPLILSLKYKTVRILCK